MLTVIVENSQKHKNENVNTVRVWLRGEQDRASLGIYAPQSCGSYRKRNIRLTADILTFVKMAREQKLNPAATRAILKLNEGRHSVKRIAKTVNKQSREVTINLPKYSDNCAERKSRGLSNSSR